MLLVPQYQLNPYNTLILSSLWSISYDPFRPFTCLIIDNQAICNYWKQHSWPCNISIQQTMSNMPVTEKKYIAKNQKPSKVLLVCVYDTVVFEITHESIRQRFQKFGTITKLLIFDKGEVTKFFIEYQEIDSAVQARKSLDGVKLYDTLCKMSIYFSNFSNVDLRHEQADCSGLYEMDMKPIPQYEDYTKSTYKQNGYSDYFDQDPIMKAFTGFDSFSSFQRSKTDNPKTLQNQIFKMRQAQNNYYMSKQQDELEDDIKKSIDSLLGPTQQSQKKPKIQNDSKLKIKEDSDIRSSVLWFPFKQKIKPENIYNLFSNFGNISCVINKKQNVYIKFRNKEYAAIVSTYLNNTSLLGTTISLRQSPEISDLWKPTENQYCQAVYYDSTSDRFTPQRSITINPPSHTIHVSSMKKQICREHVLRNIFQEYGKVEKIHILQQSNERNMALIKFSSLQDSFCAVMNLHNENFSGRKMQISFTKSRI